MYTLRIIEDVLLNDGKFSQSIRNISLGNFYSHHRRGSVVFKREVAPLLINNVRSVILDSDQRAWLIMENDDKTSYSYFIMTENGATFERI